MNEADDSEGLRKTYSLWPIIVSPYTNIQLRLGNRLDAQCHLD